ncbi:MAG: DNA gyrase inhibitor YacG [Burkholderiaceae bacterium]|jgi:endogenous inhibitor of DNA gyrase (YacG/DUF329 family)|nr:DNA gyrase inhibitor YacG [Burkholderiaceae bacterium]
MSRKITMLSSQPSSPRTVRCPACGGPSLYSPANRWRPFCSQRCKLQDLGAWASERFRIEEHEPDGGQTNADPGDADPGFGGGNSGTLVH